MTPEAFDERKARQQFVRNRQKMVFTIAIAMLAVILVVALLVFFGVIGQGGTSTAKKLPNYGVTAPCATTDDTGVAKAVAPNYVTVRVRNATDKVGLADAISEELINRGFVTQTPNNYPGTEVMERTQIQFGKNAINQAYTLAGHFNDAVLVMDNREDQLIDVVVGATFQDLNDEEDVTTATDQPLTSIKGCVAADQMTNVPETKENINS